MELLAQSLSKTRRLARAAALLTLRLETRVAARGPASSMRAGPLASKTGRLPVHVAARSTAFSAPRLSRSAACRALWGQGPRLRHPGDGLRGLSWLALRGPAQPR